MIASLLAALALAGAPAQATSVTIGRWKVEPQGADRCHMIASFGTHMVLNIAADAAGNATLIVYDDRWKLEAPRSYAARYSWDGWKSESDMTLKSFTASNGLTLLGARADTGFTEALAAARHLWLRVPELDFAGDFDIPESGKLLVALQSCNARR